MPICPACKYENTFGSLICMRCFKLLPTGTITSLPNTTLHRPPLEPAKSGPLRSGTDLLNQLGLNDINVVIKNASFVVSVTSPVVLGRYNSSSGGSQLHVDLTPFGAFEQGISRMHAAIKRTESGL